MKLNVLFASVGVLGLLACAAIAQPAKAPPPDTSHITITLPADLKWTGVPGERRAMLYGDPEKEGPYAILYEWAPGHNSKPHFHVADRFGYVVSGTWWMSSSPTEDKSTLYPAPAGSFVTHYANQIHWDGGVDNTAIVLVSGIGPIKTTRVGAP